MTTLDEARDGLSDPFPNDTEREQLEQLIRQLHPNLSDQQLTKIMELLVLGEERTSAVHAGPMRTPDLHSAP